MYLSRFRQNSVDAPELVVVNANGNAFYVAASLGKSVQWSVSPDIDDNKRVVFPVLGETRFKRVVRSGVRQLVGFDTAGSFIYDF